MVLSISIELLAAAVAVAGGAALMARRTTEFPATANEDDAAVMKLPRMPTLQQQNPTADTLVAQELLGEELVDAANAHAIAERMVAEADRVWASPADGWRTISSTRGVVNEGSRVSGAFASSGIEFTRASAVVDAPADALFELLASPAGYQLIDPFTDPKDHEKPPLESFDTSHWRRGEDASRPQRIRLEAATALAKIPLLTTREFVVLNYIDYSTRYFLSKSIRHARLPGSSAFGPRGHEKPANGCVRALNTFGVQIEPLASDPQRKCVVRLLNFADLGGKFPVVVTNYANRDFLVGLVERMRKAMAAAPSSAAGSASTINTTTRS